MFKFQADSFCKIFDEANELKVIEIGDRKRQRSISMSLA